MQIAKKAGGQIQGTHAIRGQQESLRTGAHRWNDTDPTFSHGLATKGRRLIFSVPRGLVLRAA